MAAVTDRMTIPGAAPQRKTPKGTFDLIFRNASFLSALFVLVLLAGIMLSMVIGGWPAFREMGFGFLTSSVWDTQNDKYGAFSAIVGTLSTALIALVIGVPLSLGIAVYLTQLAPPWFKQPVSTAIELLAAVPSIIYGMWGLFVLVPFVQTNIQLAFGDTLAAIPLIGGIFQTTNFAGTSLFTAGLVLAVMILPFIAATMRDVFEQVPPVYKESAYGLGATRWEVVSGVVLPYTRISVVGGIMLAQARA